EALRAKALAAGARVLRGVRFVSCARIADGDFNWQLMLAAETETLSHRARYLVDCSGRRAVVAKALRVPLVPNDDQLFAYAQWFASAGGEDDRDTRIEAGAHGWWYSNRLPGAESKQARRLIVFLSDKDLRAAKMAARPGGFDLLLEDSKHIAA